MPGCMAERLGEKVAKIWTFNPQQIESDVEPLDVSGIPYTEAVTPATLNATQKRRLWRRRSFTKFFRSVVIALVFMGVWSAALMGFGYLEGDWLRYQHLQRNLLIPGMAGVWLFSVIVAKVAGRL